MLADAEDFPHLVEALDTVVRKLGGVTQVWRFDRMATVCSPATGRLSAAFAQVAKHYRVRSVLCPPRRGNRKGVVEKANHAAAQRWWRTLADEITLGQAQAGLDRLSITLDERRRTIGGEPTTVGAWPLPKGADRSARPDKRFTVHPSTTNGSRRAQPHWRTWNLIRPERDGSTFSSIRAALTQS